MFAIVSKSDGFPVSRQIGGGNPDMVVTWTSDARAKAFLSAKGMDARHQVVPLTEDSLNKMAKALGCAADAIAFDAYPEK